MTLDELAKELYDTYKEAAGGVSVITGAKLPDFKDCPPAVQDCWIEVAEAVTNMVLNGSFSYLFYESEDL